MTTTLQNPHHQSIAKIKIQQLPGGQLVVSIPQALGTALGLKKGEEMVWKIDGKRLYMERAR